MDRNDLNPFQKHWFRKNLKMMRLDPARAKEVSTALAQVVARIRSATETGKRPPRLVAVSKLKPAEDILALHQDPALQIHFGENYAQELLDKAQFLPLKIEWHFIGALQSNKCGTLAERIGNLWVESVDTEKKMNNLNKGRSKLSSHDSRYEGIPLKVFVQVNTSGEQEKSGVKPEETLSLCRHVIEKCPNLKLKGLMTIGAIARSEAAKEGQENEDFIILRDIRDQVAKELGLTPKDLELSMGMSSDFESAIRCGSNEVRVGSTIFGERPPKADAKVKETAEEGQS